jgi:heme exporter protein CcmD
MTHLGYVLAAYLSTAGVLIATIAWVAFDLRAQKKKLARLEEKRARSQSRPTR